MSCLDKTQMNYADLYQLKILAESLNFAVTSLTDDPIAVDLDDGILSVLELVNVQLCSLNARLQN